MEREDFVNWMKGCTNQLSSERNIVVLLSFYRAPRKVIKELIGIKRKFSWRGVEEERCISWVSWKEVCKFKEDDGLGIRDGDSMNILLLI